MSTQFAVDEVETILGGVWNDDVEGDEVFESYDVHNEWGGSGTGGTSC
ncbi:hypothetical protein [Streptomyces canus]